MALMFFNRSERVSEGVSGNVACAGYLVFFLRSFGVFQASDNRHSVH